MFLVGNLALPFAVFAGVGPERIKKRVATAQRAVTHDHDALIATLDAIEHLDDDVVESIPDHNTCRARLVPYLR
jgi:hypothetical protein